MKIILSVLISLLLSITASSSYGQKSITKEFPVKDYNQINVRNSLDVTLIPADKEGVTVVCDERLLPAIEIVRRGSTLEIGWDWKKLDKLWGRKRSRSISISKGRVKINGTVFEGGIEVTVYLKQIKKIKTSSSGDVEWKGSLPTNDLTLQTSSSGDITWQGLLTVKRLHIDCSSSGDVAGDYKGEHAVVALSSSGDFEGNVQVENLEVFLSSSADFKGKVKAHEATFKLSSSSDAEVKGTIDSLYVKASSSADFYGKKIVYKKAEVSTESSANIYLSKSGKVVDKTSKRTGVFVE